MDKRTFITQMCKNVRYDPLSMFWYAFVYNTTGYLLCHYQPYSCLRPLYASMFDDMSMFTVVCVIYRTGEFAIKCHNDTQFINFGHKHGLWNYVDRREKYILSNEFIERAATYAYLCMHVHMCKDIARMIARKVARMYLDDIKFIQSLTSSPSEESKIRERILRHLDMS